MSAPLAGLYPAQAERSVLGALMLSNRAWESVGEILSPEDFAGPEHGSIFRAIRDLASAGRPFDVVTLSDTLERTGKLQAAGGLAYLGTLAKDTPTAANAASYARIVREYSQRRELVEVAGQLSEGATGKAPLADIVAATEAALLRVSERAAPGGPRSIGEIFQGGYFDELQRRADGQAVGLGTGFPGFDRLTAGLRAGQLVVVAGRPGTGKSALAMNIAEHVAIRQGLPVLVFSLEMPEEEITDRLLSAVGGIPLSDILAGKVSGEGFATASRKLADAPLAIDDTGGLAIQQIRTRALRHKRKHGLALLVLDYLQLIRAKSENRFQEVSEVSRSLKALAKELHVPVIALSQLNRSLENRPDPTPRLSDLRESGQLEQDADLVAFLFDEGLQSDAPENAPVTTLEIAKQRNGPRGKVYLLADLARVRFRNLAGGVQKPAPRASGYY